MTSSNRHISETDKVLQTRINVYETARKLNISRLNKILEILCITIKLMKHKFLMYSLNLSTLKVIYT